MSEQQLIDDAKALALVTTSYYPSLEGVELTYRQYTFSESQLKKMAELIKARALEQAANIVVEQRGKDGIAIANKILALIQTEECE